MAALCKLASYQAALAAALKKMGSKTLLSSWIWFSLRHG
jgi:hypothetical protein